MGMLITGLAMGAILFAIKWCSFWLLTSYKNPDTGEMEQRVLPRWLLFGDPEPVRDRIHRSTFLLFCQDLLWGYIGMHMFAVAGASNLAFVALSAYSTTCMVVLMWEFILRWGKRKFKGLFGIRSKQHKYSWQE